MKKHFVHTSESVTDGHPDKLCDQISDAIVDRFLEQDPYSRVAAECAVSLSVVFIAARFSSRVKVDFPNVARKVIRRLGYMDPEFDFRTCSILTSLKQMETNDRYTFDEDTVSDEEISLIPATEQVTIFGFACDQSPTLMPLPIWLAHQLSRRLSTVRTENMLPYLAPDGTIQVGVEYRDQRPARIQSLTINASLKDRSHPQSSVLQHDMMEYVVKTVFEDESVKPDDHTAIFINHGEPLKLGGPAIHSGLTGRKIAVDTYGGYSRMSGSALSGKDPLRVDRVGAYAARYAAKNVVAAGLARECELLLSYSIGRADPVSIEVDTRGTGKVPDELLTSVVSRAFDFRLASIVKQFNLRRLPSLSKGGFYRKLAAYGHFGRTDLELPWEATDKVDSLRSMC
jgi:S-adenosylmethionine synthetase